MSSGIWQKIIKLLAVDLLELMSSINSWFVFDFSNLRDMDTFSKSDPGRPIVCLK